MFFKFIGINSLVCMNLFSLQLYTSPPLVILDGNNSGFIKDGSSWSSTTLKGKVHIVFYVDPDEKDVNEHVESILNNAFKEYPTTQILSYAIINMSATWKPNFILQAILESKQEKFSDTLFIRDNTGLVAKKWNLLSDAYTILVFSKEAKLIYKNEKKLQKNDIKELIDLIHQVIKE